MTVYLRNTIPVGVAYEPLERDSVRIAETVYIGEGDSVAVMVANTALGVVPVIIPIGANERSKAQPRRSLSKRPTDPAPAPAAMRNDALPRTPASVQMRRPRRFSETIMPKAKE